MKTNRKMKVFWVINIQIFILCVLLIFFSPEVLIQLGPYLLATLVGNGVNYSVNNVVHAWQKSKHYKMQLDRDNEKT